LIFYISDKRPELLDAVCDKLYLAITKIQNVNIKNLVITNAGTFALATRFVIDLSSIKNTSNEIVGAIRAFQSINGTARVILIADKEPLVESLLNRLINMGVYDILLDLDEAGLEKSLTTGYTEDEAFAQCMPMPAPAAELPPRPAAAVREVFTANMNFKKRKPYITIAICSAEAHIGATHQALLMGKFLSTAGFRVCYLEANRRRKIMYLARIYPINANEKNRMLQFEGIDMYFDVNMLEAARMGYDFYIYDFGRIEEMDAQSFVSKDMRFVVGGAKAWEMPSYDPVLAIPGAEQSFSFILNHVPKNEMPAIQEMMAGFKLYFSDYAPYPFQYGVNFRAYKEIFREYLTVAR